jgi:hypothetical protein
MRRELAGLYDMDEREMGASVDRITLRDILPRLRCPLLVAGGGRDLITPGQEAWRIFEGASCERELIYYPDGAHDCFNVLADLRPRVVAWLTRQLETHRAAPAADVDRAENGDEGWMAAEAVDPDFADALRGDTPRLAWNRVSGGDGTPTDVEAAAVRMAPARRWPWVADRLHAPAVIRRMAATLPAGGDGHSGR